MHVTGEIALTAFDVVFTECEHEFEAAVDVDGVGYIYDQSLSGGECTITPCADGDQFPAPIDVASSSYLMAAELCFEHSLMGEFTCEMELEMEPIVHEGPVLWLEDVECLNNSTIEVTAEWEAEAPGGGYPEIEFDAAFGIFGGNWVPHATTMDYTNVPFGGSLGMIFQNNTGGTLLLTGPQLSGLGAGRFTLGRGCANTAPVFRGRTCRVRITKNTTAGTLTNAQLVVGSDWGNSTPVVTLSN